MSKHTPGPWIFYADVPSMQPDWHIVTTANRMRVLANVHIEPGNAVDLSNAHLIAAAPDLLAALKTFILIAEGDGWHSGGHPMRDAALHHGRLAVAKAEAAIAALSEPRHD